MYETRGFDTDGSKQSIGDETHLTAAPSGTRRRWHGVGSTCQAAFSPVSRCTTLRVTLTFMKFWFLQRTTSNTLSVILVLFIYLFLIEMKQLPLRVVPGCFCCFTSNSKQPLLVFLISHFFWHDILTGTYSPELGSTVYFHLFLPFLLLFVQTRGERGRGRGAEQRVERPALGERLRAVLSPWGRVDIDSNSLLHSLLHRLPSLFSPLWPFPYLPRRYIF